jgi:hypothetical protein
VNGEDLERHLACSFLKSRLKELSAKVKRTHGLAYDFPICFKCESVLSKSEGSHLICLKCGAKYELKEL